MNVAIDVLLTYRIKTKFSVVISIFFYFSYHVEHVKPLNIALFLYFLKEDISIKDEFVLCWLETWISFSSYSMYWLFWFLHHAIKDFKAEKKISFLKTLTAWDFHTLLLIFFTTTCNFGSLEFKFKLLLRYNTDTNFDYMVYSRFMSSMWHSNNIHQPVAYVNAALKKKNCSQVLTTSLQLPLKLLCIY